MKRNNLVHNRNDTVDGSGTNGNESSNDYERDSFLTNHTTNHPNNNYNNHTNGNHGNGNGNDISNRNSKNQNYSYNPLLQTNFDLKSITSSTKAATSYMDELEVIQTIGTTHSRKGKYIRSTWKKSRRTKYMLYSLGVCIFLLLLYSSSRSSSSSSRSSSSASDDEKYNGNGGDDGDKKHLFDHGNDSDVDGMGGEYAHLQINDYTNLNPNILHSSSHAQNSILKKITKSCLKQSQHQSQKLSQDEIDMICSHPKCTIQNPFLGQGYENLSSSWNKALDENIKLIEDYLSKSYTMYNQYRTTHGDGSGSSGHGHSHDNNGSYDHNTDDGIIDEHNMLDVVFYGDSIIEQWNGRWMGNAMTSKAEIESVYQRYFDPFSSSSSSSTTSEEEENDHDHDNMKKKNHNNYRQNHMNTNMDTLKGLALGIAGDKTTNLLYRLQEGGELPDELQSKVYWLLIGTNDLSQNCSEDIVILGILSVVQEIRSKKPNSIVVINGLLPRTDDVDGRLISTSTIDMKDQSQISNGSSSDGSDGLDENDGKNDVETQEKESIMPSSSTTNSSSHYNHIRHNQKERHGKSTIATNYKKNHQSPIFNYWPSIEAINHQLKLYAQKHDQIEYFDPSHLFLAQMGNEFYKQDDLFLMKELQGDDFLHPTALGHEIWAKVNKDKNIFLF